VRTRVVILGSAPDARWPKNDVVYAAKMSLGYYPEAIDSTTSVHTVGYAGDQRALLDDPVLLRRLKRSGLDSMTVGVRVEEDADDVRAEFTALFTATAVAVRQFDTMSRVQRRVAWEKPSGMREPILRGIPSYGAAGVRYAGARMFRYSYKRLSARLTSDSPRLIRRHAIFRPSTGVVTLGRAMTRFGPEAEYVLAGVSLAWPRRYSDADRDAYRGGEDFAPIPVHINADRQVLKRLLVKGWDLKATNRELSELVSVPLLQA
jgi:hypothetical protein